MCRRCMHLIWKSYTNEKQHFNWPTFCSSLRQTLSNQEFSENLKTIKTHISNYEDSVAT